MEIGPSSYLPNKLECSYKRVYVRGWYGITVAMLFQVYSIYNYFEYKNILSHNNSNIENIIIVY